MIHNLKPYPAMKDSGVPWLGKVPAHWDVQPIGRIGQLFKGNGGNKEDEVPAGIPCVRYGDLYTRHEFFVQSTKACVAPDRAASYTTIRYGNVLFAASGETIEDIGRSAVNLLETDARCGGDVLVLRPTIAADAKFLGYAADSSASRHQKACMGRGFTVVHIYASELKRLALPLPPLPEQAAIVRFLDHADRRIRRYIRAKQKLVKLLQEQKQAIIHRAVTRGLDPNVRLKPSGVEWLADVPEHWEVQRLRSLAHIKTGERDTVDRVDNGQYAFFVRSQTVERINSWSFDGEAVLTAGDGAGVAKVFHYVNGKFDYHQRVYKFSDFRAILGRFFFEYFRATLKFEALAGNAKSTVDSLRRPMLQNFPVVVPPQEEQEAIIDHLKGLGALIDNAIDGAAREISLLREYRTRLIADVVTGKLDVREAAAQLPDEAEEPEPLDEPESLTEAEEATVDDPDAAPEKAEA